MPTESQGRGVSEDGLYPYAIYGICPKNRERTMESKTRELIIAQVDKSKEKLDAAKTLLIITHFPASSIYIPMPTDAYQPSSPS